MQSFRCGPLSKNFFHNHITVFGLKKSMWPKTFCYGKYLQKFFYKNYLRVAWWLQLSVADNWLKLQPYYCHKYFELYHDINTMRALLLYLSSSYNHSRTSDSRGASIYYTKSLQYRINILEYTGWSTSLRNTHAQVNLYVLHDS